MGRSELLIHLLGLWEETCADTGRTSHTSRSILTTTTQQPPSLCPENECWRSSLLVQMFHQNEFPSDTILSRYGEINVAHGHVRMQTYQRFAEMLTAKIVSW